LIGLLDKINEWNFLLGESLRVQLGAGSAWALFVVFAAGVLTSLTPCVYPIMPVIVSFIGGSAGGNRRRAVALSVVYVLALASVYAVLGVVAGLAGLTFGDFTRNPWVYGSIGLLLVVFALAMLDRITIPALFTGVQGAGARRGGYLGAVLMGIAGGFVAAPCTAPVAGALLVHISQTRNALWGGTLMFVFALGIGLLLMLLGIFSGLGASLPKPGPWMNWIKYGFAALLMLAAVWFFLWPAAEMLWHRGGSA
jgi:thiol:disulfide interchange protein DsbD